MTVGGILFQNRPHSCFYIESSINRDERDLLTSISTPFFAEAVNNLPRGADVKSLS
jgi:hypothetical protein